MNSEASVVDPAQVRTSDELASWGKEALLDVGVEALVNKKAAQDITNTVMSTHQTSANWASNEVEALGIQLGAALGRRWGRREGANIIFGDLV